MDGKDRGWGGFTRMMQNEIGSGIFAMEQGALKSLRRLKPARLMDSFAACLKVSLQSNEVYVFLFPG